MPSADPTSSTGRRALTLQDIFRLYAECRARNPTAAEDDLVKAVEDTLKSLSGVPSSIPEQTSAEPFWITARNHIRAKPQDWFGSQPIDERDRALLNATSPAWVELGQKSYLRNMYTKKIGGPFETTAWLSENNEQCLKLIKECGARLDPSVSPQVSGSAFGWEHMKVNVNVQMQGDVAPGVEWGFLSGKPSNIRVYPGPPSTSCPLHHTSDAIILRDFATGTAGIGDVESISERSFDILLMHTCDFDYPWLVVAVKDSGKRIEETCCLGF